MNKRRKIISVILCILMTLSLGVNASATTVEEIKGVKIVHVSDEVFSGYEGIETTVLGKVGYNYALNTPNGKHTILFGFTPYDRAVYKIATGWAIKLPYLSIDEKSFYQSDNGYTYSIDNSSDKFNIADFPSEHTLISNSASIPAHSWKIALRIKSGDDYHFMKISNTSGAAWQQKAGQGGPVMQLLSGKTPSTVSWDMYAYNSSTGKYVVDKDKLGYYNSSIYYMIIKD